MSKPQDNSYVIFTLKYFQLIRTNNILDRGQPETSPSLQIHIGW